jgi:hypothetical protein
VFSKLSVHSDDEWYQARTCRLQRKSERGLKIDLGKEERMRQTKKKLKLYYVDDAEE